MELASHLTGRFASIELFPYSFKEFLEQRQFHNTPGTTKETGLLTGLFKDYSESGGFPEVAGGETPDRYIQDLFNAIVTRDIVYRHNIKGTSKNYFLLRTATK